MNFKHIILASVFAFTGTNALAAADTAPCEPTDITLYFADGEAVLSEHAKAALQAELERIQHCNILTIDAYAVSNDSPALTSPASLSSERTAAALNAIYRSGVIVPVDKINVSYEPEDNGRAPIGRMVAMTLMAEPRQPNS